MLRSKQFEKETDKVEEWYETKYSVQDIDSSLLQKIQRPSLIPGAKKLLGLPPANKLIPKNFEIKAANPKLSVKPNLIKQWADTDLWYMKDDKYERPKCKVSMKLYTNDCGLGFTAESRVFANVWSKVLDEYMREFNYMANCANMSFTVTPNFENVEFSW